MRLWRTVFVLAAAFAVLTGCGDGGGGTPGAGGDPINVGSLTYPSGEVGLSEMTFSCGGDAGAAKDNGDGTYQTEVGLYQGDRSEWPVTVFRLSDSDSSCHIEEGNYYFNIVDDAAVGSVDLELFFVGRDAGEGTGVWSGSRLSESIIETYVDPGVDYADHTEFTQGVVTVSVTNGVYDLDWFFTDSGGSEEIEGIYKGVVKEFL
jgi:hypothetical protein